MSRRRRPRETEAERTARRVAELAAASPWTHEDRARVAALLLRPVTRSTSD